VFEVKAKWIAAVIAICSAGGLAGADTELAVCTIAPSIQWMPAASGSRVVWVDQRNGSNDIYLYDVAAGATSPITTAAGDQMWPEIDGNRIVWMDHRSGSWEIYLYDLMTGVERSVASAPTSDVWHSQGPDIDGDLIVWADDRYHPSTGHLDVFLYDLSAEQLTRITDDNADQGAQGPRIQGGRVVWCDRRADANGDIYMYNVTTEEESVVAEGSASQGQPDIWGDIVVWAQAADAAFDIWYRDVTGPTAGALIAADYTQDHPRVNGRWVVWSDDRNGGGDTTQDEVYAYDLQEGEERPLISSPHPYGNLGPTIAESGLVAWQDFRNGDRDAYTNSDIYGYVLPMFPDVLATHWAYDSVEACVDSEIVSGYPDGTYQPEYPVTRDQMAVFISRAICTPTGEAGMVDYVPPTTPSFSDVPTDFWCYKYIEYAAEHNVVGGYGDGTYQPELPLDRGQMAVFIARALVTPSGDVGVPDPTGDPTFPDVPADFWSYRHIEYVAGEGVAGGYSDGLYYPARPCSRDQMAVFICRAFDLVP
jgi:beta propeller repeat protein